MPERTVFLTGATGYIGARLLGALRDRGDRVRALTRKNAQLDGAEVVVGDVRDAARLVPSLEEVDVAYYLVHSLGERDFGGADREAAASFAAAAEEAGVRRLVYLGGLGRGDLSPHLASRQEVGRILRESAVPTIELRASIVVGEGSVSFDAFRTLAQLPVAILPDWVETASQPIAVDDVVAYLLEAATVDVELPAVYEIGGAEQVPYSALLEELGTAVATVPAPGAVVDLAALLKPFEPERARVVTDLLDSLRVDTSVHDAAALGAFEVRPRGLADAVRATQTRG